MQMEESVDCHYFEHFGNILVLRNLLHHTVVYQARNNVVLQTGFQFWYDQTWGKMAVSSAGTTNLQLVAKSRLLDQCVLTDEAMEGKVSKCGVVSLASGHSPFRTKESTLPVCRPMNGTTLFSQFFL